MAAASSAVQLELAPFMRPAEDSRRPAATPRLVCVDDGLLIREELV